MHKRVHATSYGKIHSSNSINKLFSYGPLFFSISAICLLPSLHQNSSSLFSFISSTLSLLLINRFVVLIASIKLLLSMYRTISIRFLKLNNSEIIRASMYAVCRASTVDSVSALIVDRAVF